MPGGEAIKENRVMLGAAETEMTVSDHPDRLLHILRALLLSEVRLDQPDLTARQLAVALIVYQSDELQTVRGLAKHLNTGKPAITRALDRLGEFDFVRRKIDVRDRRSVNVVRTEAGATMIARLKAAASANPDIPECLTTPSNSDGHNPA